MPIARQNGGKRKRSLKNQVGSIQIDRDIYIIQPNNNTQIRGLTRLLLREGLTHDARVKAQSQLKELQSRKASLEKNEIERNHQLKYRKIKFIEKKKVLRKENNGRAFHGNENFWGIQVDSEGNIVRTFSQDD